MRAVVTGANGFVGLHTIRGLLDAGYDVLAVDIIDSQLKARFEGVKRCEIATLDILSDDLEKVINRIGVLLKIHKGTGSLQR